MATQTVAQESATDRQVRMAFKLAKLSELARAAECFDWIVLGGNVGERSDEQATSDFRDAVTNFRVDQGIQKPDPADDPSNALRGK